MIAGSLLPAIAAAGLHTTFTSIPEDANFERAYTVAERSA